MHGLGGAAATNWVYIAPLLADEGYCVFALTYGRPPGMPPITGGFAPMEQSAEELAEFVDRVLEETGSEQVDLVGHSEGTVMPQYYLKFLDGAPDVRRYVALTPLYDGTTLNSTSEILDRLTTEIPGLGDVVDGLCASCTQFFHDSDFMKKLNEGGAAVPGIEYTTVMTKYDQLVTPYTSGHLDSPNATNIVLQDVCRRDFAEHVAVAFDPNVGQMVLNALDPANAEPVQCLPGTE
ncbi:alpha/beta fold hydrolase [Saccharopolyspora erythraea]|nr:alpha/beta fold hydrolase [Saccharopolyspora erythraea]